MMTAAQLLPFSALGPALLMARTAAIAFQARHAARAWSAFRRLTVLAAAISMASLVAALFITRAELAGPLPGLEVSLPGAWIAVLVQVLGAVIGAFSCRYLEGEAGQQRYVAALSAVLACVHLLLLADHWLVLIAAWAGAGWALQSLLCFYADRPFAQLAVLKKRLADRLADLLLLIAAVLAWSQVDSASIGALSRQLAAGGEVTTALQASAVCLALAVILRSALFPVHGWLIQVMEAPTPVSALLHAGVVNLGGFVVIRCAALFDAVPAARGLLLLVGLATALLAGLSMLTRVSIKVRLAWSTVAQMGFMLMECGLGLYTLALLHLIGHSLYKVHAFLAASSVVRDSRLRAMAGAVAPAPASLLLAPLAALALITGAEAALAPVWPGDAWPGWWNAILALAFAPLLWIPGASSASRALRVRQAVAGACLLLLLLLLARFSHALPLGTRDAPHGAAGLLVLAGMTAHYLVLALLQWQPQRVSAWRRWSYAGFYVDEIHTRLALGLGRGGFATPSDTRSAPGPVERTPLAETP